MTEVDEGIWAGFKFGFSLGALVAAMAVNLVWVVVRFW